MEKIRYKEEKMNWGEILKAVLFGIIEGITEWLPISSTGHMILFARICNIKKCQQNLWRCFLL